MSDGLMELINQELNRQMNSFFSCFHPGNLPNQQNPLYIQEVFDVAIFYKQYEQAKELIGDSRRARKYLKSKNLESYGDLLDMHHRIIGYVHETDPVRNVEVEAKMTFGGHEPEFRGEGKSLLNVLDFLVAIPFVPHSPNPEQPTITGLFLSASQAVLRDERFFFCPLPNCSHHDLMHMLLTHAVILSAYARTTTGEPVCDSHDACHPSEDSRLTPVGFLFENFAITNAIVFNPRNVLLTVLPRFTDNNTSPPRPHQLIYNIFESGRALAVSSPEEETVWQDSSLLHNNLPIELMRNLRPIIF